MSATLKKITFLFCLLGMVSSTFAVAPDFLDKLNADSRPEADQVRDGARRPYQVMMLAGVEEGMTALDISAGGGWYTRVLAAAVGSSGMVYTQGLGGRGGPPQDIISMPNVEAVSNVSDVPGNSIDIAVFGLESHHQDDESGPAFFREIYAALKPGGTLVYTEHVGDADSDYAGLHRLPVEVGRRWVQQAGFEIVEESDILRNTADDHTLPIFNPIIARNTDRMLFILRKPTM